MGNPITYSWPAEHELLVRDIVDKVRSYIPYAERKDVITLFGLSYKGPENPIRCSYCRKVLKHKQPI